MPRFSPFPGLRYAPEIDLADVTSPPYDVLTRTDRDRLIARHPNNVVQIDLPVADASVAGTGEADTSVPGNGEDPYRAAAALFEGWQESGVLVRDSPSLYVYRMDHLDEAGVARHTTGVIGALELSRPGEGGILPHERTTTKAKSDRLDLTRATNANLSAVWGLSSGTGLSDLLATDENPLATWTDSDGVAHSLWLITDPQRQQAISDCVEGATIVIADGHHRFETALAYRDEVRSANGQIGGEHDSTMAFVVELAEGELNVQPIHRLLCDLPSELDIVAALAKFFRLEDQGSVAEMGTDVSARLVDEGALGLVTRDRWSLLRPRPEAFAGVRDLDTVRLDHVLAGFPPHSLVFQHGVQAAVRQVRDGMAQAAVLLRPATVSQIVEIADGGERMPPKTTFFFPKPNTGVVFRTLDG